MADVLIDKYRVKVVRQGTTPANPGNVTTDPLPPVNPPGNGDVPPISFLQLTDTPTIYASQALKVVRVNAGETGLEFTTVDVLGTVLTGYTVGSNTALSDTDTILQAFGKVQGQINARVSGTGTNNFVPKFTASGTIVNSNIFENVGVGIGTTNIGNFALRISRTIAGASTVISASNTGEIQTGVNIARIWATGVNIQAGASIARIEHFQAAGGALGAGSSIATQWGFFAEQTLGTTSTVSVGFYGNLAAGTDKWNLFMNGTANNYLAGNLWIGTTSGTNTLDVNGTARIRTVSNATGNFVTLSATGVLQQRTAAEVVTDLGGFTGLWTLTGSDIYRNSRIRVGSTSAPIERIDLDSDGGWIRVSNGDRTGGVLLGGGIIFPYTTANAASRSWSVASDNGTAYGQFVIRRSATAAGDPKLGTVSLVIDNVGSVGINGVPFSSGSFTYLDVYGRATTHSGVLRLLSSTSANGFQAYVLNGVCVSQTIGSVPWTFGINSGEQFRIASSGNILFNTTTDLGFKHYFAGTTAFQGLVTFQENVVTDIAFGTVTGTKIGTSNTQKFAFWNATPIVQPLETALANTPNTGDANTDALITALKNVILNTGLARSA